MSIRGFIERRHEIRRGQAMYDRLDAMSGAHNPEVLEQQKLLGHFILTIAELPFSHTGDAAAWRTGDPYLDITIPPLGRHSMTLEDLHESHRLTAQYIAMHGLQANTDLTLIGSRTNSRFAKVAQRSLGFNIAMVDPSQYPEGYYEDSKRVYDRVVKGKHGPEFEMAFVYQTPGQLLGHYAESDPAIAALQAQPPALPANYHIPGLQIL
jgi:hypothetical protein